MGAKVSSSKILAYQIKEQKEGKRKIEEWGTGSMLLLFLSSNLVTCNELAV